jgi:hypothetical protein
LEIGSWELTRSIERHPASLSHPLEPLEKARVALGRLEEYIATLRTFFDHDPPDESTWSVRGSLHPELFVSLLQEVVDVEIELREIVHVVRE